MPSKLPTTPWKGVLSRPNDKMPWDVSKIEKILQPALTPRGATVEVILRAVTTLRRSVESATPDDLDRIRAMPIVPAAMHYFLGFDDGTPACSRMLEHTIMCATHLMGTPTYDADIALDQVFLAAIQRSLSSEQLVTVAASCQWIRRVSEISDVSQILVFDDLLFNSMVELLELSKDSSSTSHLLSAFINLAASTKANFIIGRCKRLQDRLVDIIFSSFSYSITSPTGRAKSGSSASTLLVSNGTAVANATKCVKVFANLLSFEMNRFEIRRMMCPKLLNAMLECQSQQSSMELVAASKLVVDFLHEGEGTALRSDLAAELTEGVKFNDRLRSTLATSLQR